MGVENAVLISGSLIGARELIAELGADADAVAREAGLPARVFEDPELFVQARRIIDYLELAAVACRRADFGLLHARQPPGPVTKSPLTNVTGADEIGFFGHGQVEEQG